MHGTHEDAAEDYPQVGGRAEENAHDGTEDGTRTRDVQELNEVNAPGGHGDVIDSVLEAVRWGLAFWLSPEDTFDECSVEEIAQK